MNGTIRWPENCPHICFQKKKKTESEWEVFGFVELNGMKGRIKEGRKNRGKKINLLKQPRTLVETINRICCELLGVG